MLMECFLSFSNQNNKNMFQSDSSNTVYSLQFHNNNLNSHNKNNTHHPSGEVLVGHRQPVAKVVVGSTLVVVVVDNMTVIDDSP